MRCARRRDREEREREVAEAEQREALKNMTDAERRAWEAAHPKELAEAPKKKWRFLQKYWHKGAFFQARSFTHTPLRLAPAVFLRRTGLRTCGSMCSAPSHPWIAVV